MLGFDDYADVAEPAAGRSWPVSGTRLTVPRDRRRLLPLAPADATGGRR